MVRRLDIHEKALWGRVIATVQPMHASKPTPQETAIIVPVAKGARPLLPIKSLPVSALVRPPSAQATRLHHELDGHWDRRINRGSILPDVSVDLHGAGLSGAYARLDGALEQAIAQRLKVLLLVTGKIRTHDRASGEGRGAIASVVRDWLASSRHASHIAAVRGAHPRHGGTGALYIVLKR
ncbi:MAG: Smr/MutS family protein [Sphingorhabdus sp.]